MAASCPCCPVARATRLTASAGIAPNKLLAKIASDINKPNNQFVMSFDKEEIFQYMRSHSVRKIPGVGKVCDLNAQSVRDVFFK